MAKLATARKRIKKTITPSTASPPKKHVSETAGIQTNTQPNTKKVLSVDTPKDSGIIWKKWGEEAAKRKAETKPSTTSTSTPTVQDKLRAHLNNILTEIETWQDAVSLTGVVPERFLNYLKAQQVAQQSIGKIRDYLTPRVEEMREVCMGTSDKQLIECYADWTPTEKKIMLDWYNSLMTDLDTYSMVKKVARKARKTKRPSKEKLIKGVKFKREDTDFNLVSISPIELLNSSEIWVFNTKTRKLGHYIADPLVKEINVKGSTLIGFDEKLSVCKTIRKPAVFFKDFIPAAKRKCKSMFDEVAATDTILTGRINTDTILLKAFK